MLVWEWDPVTRTYGAPRMCEVEMGQIARHTQARAANRDTRKKEATERNAAWGALSTDAKIASLRMRRGESKKQLKRLGVE